MKAGALDTLLEVETPEGVHLHLPIAGLAPRMLAGLVDLLILMVVWIAVSFVIGLLGVVIGRVATIFGLLVTFLLSWFYPAACELLMDGQTLGKRWLGLRVLQTSGAPVTWRHSVVRSVLWSIDLFFCISLPVMLLGRDFRRIGDLAADTVVVYVDRQSGKPKAAGDDAGGEPVSAGRFSVAETQAILAFAERGSTISEARRRELAGIVAPGFGTEVGETLEALRNHARYVQGAKR